MYVNYFVDNYNIHTWMKTSHKCVYVCQANLKKHMISKGNWGYRDQISVTTVGFMDLQRKIHSVTKVMVFDVLW